MKEALGLVETRGLSTAVLVADIMVKTANVHIIDIENTKGLGYMTIKISGNVGAVNAAVTAGRQIALENNAFVSSKVIPRTSEYIEGAFCQPKKEQTESKVKEKAQEIKKVKEELQPKESEMKEEAIQTSIDISKETSKSIVEEEKKDEEKETPNTENAQSEEKKVKKNSRKKKETKKDNDDKA